MNRPKKQKKAIATKPKTSSTVTSEPSVDQWPFISAKTCIERRNHHDKVKAEC